MTPYRMDRQVDEYITGILGRLADKLDFSSLSGALEGLRWQFQAPGEGGEIRVVAQSLGIDIWTLARQHSLLSATRAFVADADSASTSAIVRHRFVHRDSPEPARLCLSCVHADEQQGRRSYWRRIHQLPGVDWCPVHRGPLVKLPLDAFMRSPRRAVDQHAVVFTTTDMLSAGSVLDRYAQLLCRWLQRDRPYSSRAMNQVAHDAAQRAGFHTSATGNNLTLLSDFAREVLPTEWLKRHLPELHQKKPGRYLSRVDGPCKDGHVAFSGPVCALALALLFDSADDAMTALDIAQASVLAKEALAESPKLEQLRAAVEAFRAGDTLEVASQRHDLTPAELEPALREALRGGLTRRKAAPRRCSTARSAAAEAAPA